MRARELLQRQGPCFRGVGEEEEYKDIRRSFCSNGVASVRFAAAAEEEDTGFPTAATLHNASKSVKSMDRPWNNGVAKASSARGSRYLADDAMFSTADRWCIPRRGYTPSFACVGQGGRARGSRYLVCEALGRLRVCERARQRGLGGGWSLSFSTPDPVTGRVWDLNKRTDMDNAKAMIRRDRPTLLVTFPEKADFEAAVEFCVEQTKAGGAFALAHQRDPRTWTLPAADKLRQIEEIVGSYFHGTSPQSHGGGHEQSRHG